MNKVILKGRLTGNPELKYTPSGSAVANFSVAESKRVKKDEQWTEVPRFHNCTAWTKTAELLNKHFSKGQEILLEGELETRSYDDKDGNKRYSTEVIVKSVEFCGSKGSSNNNEKPAEENFAADEIPF